MRDDEKDARINTKEMSEEDYGRLIARRYYDKLYKEFVIVDLTHHEKGM